MFGAALIVFRESFEAALLIGILAAAMRDVPGRNRWLASGIGAGLAGAIMVAGLTEVIANAANGSGQELFNAAILGFAVLMLAWHNIWMAAHGADLARRARQLGTEVGRGARALSSVAILAGLAVLREGSETALFLYGIFTSSEMSGRSLVAGGLLGLAAGIAIGVGVYAGLLRIPSRRFFSVVGTMLVLLAAGLASQMARFLIQADLLPSLASPLWDTSWLLSNDSLLGAPLRILIGYEAQPSGTQVLFYAATLIAIIAATRWVRRQRRPLGNAQVRPPTPNRG
ncbi:MAG: FTR1 family protein [Betaproteobacteria bacterium]